MVGGIFFGGGIFIGGIFDIDADADVAVLLKFTTVGVVAVAIRLFVVRVVCGDSQAAQFLFSQAIVANILAWFD